MGSVRHTDLAGAKRTNIFYTTYLAVKNLPILMAFTESIESKTMQFPTSK